MRKLGAVGCFALLASCGGSGGSGGGSVVLPAATPTPTPTATPPTYLSARDFSRDRTASDFGARIERFSVNGAPPQPWRTVSLSTTTVLGGIGFTYHANPKAYRAVYLNEVQDFTRIETIPPDRGMVGDQDYRPADPGPLLRYFRSVQSDDTNPLYNLDYVGTVSWSDYTASTIEGSEKGDREVWRYHLYGAVTVASDLPTAGVTVYRSKFSPTAALATSYDLTINWTTGELTGTARVPCPQNETCSGGDLGDLRLVGHFDGSRRILGTITGSAGYGGTFVGGFYGPRAVEIGIVGDYRHATRANNIFATTAKRFP